MDYVVIMAAGDGTRMKSKIHKVLHKICGKAIIEYGIDLAKECGVEKPIVIVKPGDGRIAAYLGEQVQYIDQSPEYGYGTGSAIKAVLPALNDDQGSCIIMAGDAPLFKKESLLALRAAVENGADCAALTAIAPNPFGYGRIIREGENIVDSIEQADCTPQQAQLNEVNVSLYCVRVSALKEAISRLQIHENKQEYYLTDIIPILSQMGKKVVPVQCDFNDSMGVNDRVQLAQAGAVMQQRILEMHMRNGVTIIDPKNTYIDAGVSIGNDSIIYPGTMLMQGSVVGEDCTILQNCRIEGSTIGRGATIESSTILDATIGDETTVGPNAYIRPKSVIGKRCRIGDFVEIKNAVIGDGTKVSHLTYVGDADLGKNINLGCGVVFVNYDGKLKQRSVVEDDAFIGCNVNLIAPVHVGQSAYVAAGSTITNDVDASDLAIARQRQSNIPGWVDKRKQEGRL